MVETSQAEPVLSQLILFLPVYTVLLCQIQTGTRQQTVEDVFRSLDPREMLLLLW
jgi:hypothetical protein